MIQLLVSLLVAPGRAADAINVLRTVAGPARIARGCRFVEIFRWADDDRRISYVEEWDEDGALRGQFGSERFLHLMELLEAAPERPVVEFRIVSETHGLEYVTPPGRALRDQEASIA